MGNGIARPEPSADETACHGRYRRTLAPADFAAQARCCAPFAVRDSMQTGDAGPPRI